MLEFRLRNCSSSVNSASNRADLQFCTFTGFIGVPYVVDASCDAGDLSMSSKCYRKLRGRRRSWYGASNDCLSRGGSLAVFADTRRPLDSSRLAAWLNASDKNSAYWIGLVRSWWKTTNAGHVRTISTSNRSLICRIEIDLKPSFSLKLGSN